MNAADTAGSEHLDARHSRKDDGRAHRRCAPPSKPERDRKVPTRKLHDVLPGRDGEKHLFRKADDRLSFNDGDRRGDGSFLADGAFEGLRGLKIPGIGHPMGDDGAFQGDDRFMADDSLRDFLGYSHAFCPFLLFHRSMKGAITR